MAIVVFDDFNRVDNPTSLGTANTGQVWNMVAGVVGINSANALWTWNHDGNARTTIESGLTDAITYATFVNPTSGSQNFGIGMGIVVRYVDESYYWRLMYYKFPGSANRLRLQRIYASSMATVIDVNITLADNDVVKVTYCGPNFEIFVNDVSKGTYDDSPNPQNYGTLCGLAGDKGSYFATITKRWDNFTVETNDPCGGGNAFAFTLPALQFSFIASVTSEIVTTERFDAGTGNSWYITLPISDAGDELRSKVIKALRATGKFTNAEIKAWGYDVGDPILVSDLENGTNASVTVSLTDSTQVAQTKRHQVNVTNAVLSTIRIDGDDTGESTRDEVHEIVSEWAEQGVRR